MYHKIRWVLGSIGLMLCIATNPLQAGLMTFNINFSGVDSVSNHTLRVFGTITVDPTLPITIASTASSLRFQHDNDAIVQLPSIPNLSTVSPEGLAWSQLGNDLYVSRISSVHSVFGWSVTNGAGSHQFYLGSGMNQHVFQHGNLGISHFDGITLKAPSGPDGPHGFLFGTAIPEPSSFSLMAGIGVVFSLTRRRRG